jgi:hypothetical protein
MTENKKKLTENKKKLTNIEKLNFFQIKDFNETLKKISIEHNTKIAIDKYKHLNTPIEKLKYPNCNVGLLTGIKNNITVVDLDFDINDVEHPFIKQFGVDFIKKFNTLTVKTPRGGYHLYFYYDVDIKQTQSKIGIDIRSDDGYIMVPPSSINGKEYNVINNKPLKIISNTLKTWLLNNIYKKKTETKKTITPKIPLNIPNENEYEIIIEKDEMMNIINKLKVDCNKTDDFRGNYVKWLSVLQACKLLGMQDEFIEWSKKTIHDNFDEDKLYDHWSNSNASISNFLYILSCAGIKNNVYTYKKVPKNSFGKHYQIEVPKLENILKPNINYLIKSDTGTGKTTMFKNYIVQNKLKFISITSRIVLSFEQHESFKECGINVEHYQDKKFEFGDNIIITPESSASLFDYDFSNYVIFLDEFDSILKHVLTSDTLNTNRIQASLTIAKMLMTSKQFICVDADISYISKMFLDSLELQYKFYINKHHHYKNTNVHIINDEKKFYEILKTKDKFILCSDSKTKAEILHDKLKEDTKCNDILLFTSDSIEQYVKLDNHKKIIFSPKIIYGLDSTIERDVFCFFEGNTITPTQMVQQIARCRNINNVYIFFSNKKSKMPSFDDINEAEKFHNENISCYNLEMINIFKKNIDKSIDENKDLIDGSFIKLSSNKLNEIFNKLYINNSYVEDCYNTNKYLHLINILKNRGFIINYTDDKNNAENHKEDKLKIYEDKMNNFDIYNEKNERINEYLKIPLDQIDNYKQYFIDKNLLTTHINISKYFFRDNTNNILNLSTRDDFDINKIKDISLKFALLDDMLKKLELNKTKINSFVPKNNVIDGHEELKERYQKLFRDRSKEVDLSKDIKLYKVVCKIYANLFSFVDFIKDKQINGFKFNLYNLIDDVYNEHKTLYKYRNPRDAI